jgi:hypothetical protein
MEEKIDGNSLKLDDFLEYDLTDADLAKILRPKKIYINPSKRHLTVLWHDNTRTSVTCSELDDFSVEHGFWAALAKKVFGNYQNYSKFFKKVVDSSK